MSQSDTIRGRYNSGLNCHGCKHLDRYKEDGRGYCSMIERSKETNKDKQRLPSMGRCELYETGDFRFRYDWLKKR